MRSQGQAGFDAHTPPSVDEPTPPKQSCIKRIATALESTSAHVYNVSVGLPSTFNTVASTFPKQVGSDGTILSDGITAASRLLYTVIAEVALLAALQAFSLRAKYLGGKKEADFNHFIISVARFSNVLSFSFAIGCKTIYSTYTGEVGGWQQIVLPITLGAISTALAALDYKLRQKDLSNDLTKRRIANIMGFGLMMGSNFYRICRLYNAIADYQPRQDASWFSIENWQSFGPIAITLLGALAYGILCFKNRQKVSQAPSTVSNVFQDLGTSVETRKAVTESALIGDLLMPVKIGILLISNGVFKYCCKPQASEADATATLLNRIT